MIITLSQLVKKKSGKVRLKPLRPPVKAESDFRKALQIEVARMLAEVRPIAARQSGLRAKYQDLNDAFQKWQKHFDNISKGMGKKLAKDIFDYNKEKLLDDLGNKLKVNVDILFDDKSFRDMVETATFEAAQLIKSIPSDYIGQVSRAVLTATKQQRMIHACY